MFFWLWGAFRGRNEGAGIDLVWCTKHLLGMFSLCSEDLPKCLNLRIYLKSCQGSYYNLQYILEVRDIGRCRLQGFQISSIISVAILATPFLVVAVVFCETK